MDHTQIISLAKEKNLPVGSLTIGDCIELAEAVSCPVSEVVLAEACAVTGLDRATVLDEALKAYSHNLHAVEVGATTGQSFIMGTVGRELADPKAQKLFDDALVNDILANTMAAQVGNHEVGLQPCAGTGDSCPYTGFLKALMDRGVDRDQLGRLAALINKIGSMFRVGKTTTGCNMEGFGAGSAALAAAFVELEGGAPAKVGQAMVLAISPTIGNPCTPRVMVPGLCAAHIGGAVVMARLTSRLVLTTTIRVTVPVDVMMAMAAAVHPLSAKAIVPEVIRYMEPFFKTHAGVERFIPEDVKAEEAARIADILQRAKAETRELARKSKPVTRPFGMAVVGGSSQAVGSPTNAGRLAHALSKAQGHGKPTKIIVELYPELFARRGINVPGVLMAAAYGADTGNGALYRDVMDRVVADNITVEIRMVPDRLQLQRVVIETAEGSVWVDTLNRGGARLVLLDSSAGKDAALALAEQMGIETVE